MASRKSNKTRVKFWGGPFAGASFPMSPGNKSMTFRCNKFFGYYESGKWKSEIVDPVLEVNDNFILGYN